MAQKNIIAWGLFWLRFGLGLFLALRAIDKIIEPEITVGVFSQFYFVDVNTSVVMLIGAIQLVLSLFLLLSMYKSLTYGLAFFIHALSSVLIFWQVVPFGVNHWFISNIPIFFSFLTLFLLRDLDNKLTLGKKKTLFT